MFEGALHSLDLTTVFSPCDAVWFDKFVVIYGVLFSGCGFLFGTCAAAGGMAIYFKDVGKRQCQCQLQ